MKARRQAGSLMLLAVLVQPVGVLMNFHTALLASITVALLAASRIANAGRFVCFTCTSCKKPDCTKLHRYPEFLWCTDYIGRDTCLNCEGYAS